METIYAERHWIKESKESDGSILTSIDEYKRTQSLGVTSIGQGTTGAPEEVEVKEHTASVAFVRGGGAFSSTFIINNDRDKEAAMKALSIIIKDLEALRNEIIKL